MRTLILPLALLLALPLAASERNRDAYVYNRGGSQFMSGGISFDSLGRITGRLNGRGLWVRRAGVEYFIDDAATLDAVDKAFAPMRELEPDLDALHHRMEPLNDDEEKLEKKIDAISDKLDDEDEQLKAGEREPLEASLRKLEAQLQQLEAKMRQLEADEERLDARQEKREAEAEQDLWRIVDQSIRKGVARKR